MLNFLSKIDIFGANANLQPEDSQKYTTKFGGFVTLLITFGYLSFCIGILIGYIDNTRLEKGYSQMLGQHADPMNFTNRDMFFAISLIYENYTNFFKDDYFNFQLYHHKVFLTNHTEIKTEIPLRPCLITDFNKELTVEEYQSLHLNMYFCPTYKDLIVSTGSASEDVWEFTEWSLKINKDIFDNDLMRNIHHWCEDFPTKVSLLFQDISIDHNNMTHPVQRYFKSKYFYVTEDFIKKNYFEFSTLKYLQSDNFFLDNYIETEYTIFNNFYYDGYLVEDRTFLMNNSNNTDYNTLIDIFIYSSPIWFSYSRKIPKFIDFLTQIQFWSILLIFGQMIATYVNSFYLRRTIQKSILKVRDHDYFNSVTNMFPKFLNIDAKLETSFNELFFTSKDETTASKNKTENIKRKRKISGIQKMFDNKNKYKDILSVRRISSPGFYSNALKNEEEAIRSLNSEKDVENDHMKTEFNLLNMNNNVPFYKTPRDNKQSFGGDGNLNLTPVKVKPHQPQGEIIEMTKKTSETNILILNKGISENQSHQMKNPLDDIIKSPANRMYSGRLKEGRRGSEFISLPYLSSKPFKSLYKVKTGLLDYINCFKTHNEREITNNFIETANNELNKNLNIVDFIEGIEELNLIKAMLFTNDELDIIRFISVKSIVYDSSFTETEEYKIYKQKILTFIKENKPYRRETIRENLYELFEEKIKQMLEVNSDMSNL